MRAHFSEQGRWSDLDLRVEVSGEFGENSETVQAFTQAPGLLIAVLVAVEFVSCEYQMRLYAIDECASYPHEH